MEQTKIVTIQSGENKVSVNRQGGCLDSIKKNDYEYLWQGAEESWKGKDVAIFPFIARLKDGIYTVDGKEYSMKNHGLIRYAYLDVEDRKDNEVTLSYSSNKDTLSQYPYNFIFKSNYLLNGGNLKVTYTIKNTDDKDLFFGIGGHPAFQIPFERVNDTDVIDGNYIEFENEFTPNNYYLDENGSFIVRKGPFEKVKRIDLKKEIFQKYKTLMFCDADMDKVTLHKKDGKDVIMHLNHPKTVAIWTKEKFGGYICIEPWNGIPDISNPNRELSQKDGINKLAPNEIYTFSYTIDI